METQEMQDQGTITLLQEQYLPILIESFLIDRRSQRLSPGTIQFYRKKLKLFLKFCDSQAGLISPGTSIFQYNRTRVKNLSLPVHGL